MMDKLHLEDQDFLQWRWHGSCWGSNSWNSSREGFLRGSWCSLWSRSSPPGTGSSSIAGHPLSFPANQNTTCYCTVTIPTFYNNTLNTWGAPACSYKELTGVSPCGSCIPQWRCSLIHQKSARFELRLMFGWNRQMLTLNIWTSSSLTISLSRWPFSTRSNLPVEKSTDKHVCRQTPSTKNRFAQNQNCWTWKDRTGLSKPNPPKGSSR